MQQVLDLWANISAWFSSQMEVFQTPPGNLWRDFLSALLDWSAWLNGGNKGLIIALVLLVLIVNRILKRQS